MDCLSIALAVSLHLGLAGDYNALHPHVRCDVNNTVALGDQIVKNVLSVAEIN